MRVVTTLGAETSASLEVVALVGLTRGSSDACLPFPILCKELDLVGEITGFLILVDFTGNAVVRLSTDIVGFSIFCSFTSTVAFNELSANFEEASTVSKLEGSLTNCEVA